MTVKKTAEPVKAPVKKAPVKAPVVRVKKAPPAKPLSRLDAVTAREFAYFMVASIKYDIDELKQMNDMFPSYPKEYLEGYETEALNFFVEIIRQGERAMDDELLEHIRDVAQTTQLAFANGEFGDTEGGSDEAA